MTKKIDDAIENLIEVLVEEHKARRSAWFALMATFTATC